MANSISNLNNGHETAIFGYNSLISLKELASLSEETLKNSGSQSSDEVLRLKANQRKLKRYIYIREVFENCIALKEKNNNTFDIEKIDLILNDIQGTPALMINCREDIDQFTDFTQFKEKIDSAIKTIELSGVQKKLSDLAIENTIETYIYLKIKTGNTLNHLVLAKEFCLENCDQEELKEIIKKNIKKYENTPVMDEWKIRAEINTKLANVNEQLEKVKIGVDKGWLNNWLYNSSDPEYSPKADKAFENYEQSFVHAASNGFGMLLMTNHLGDKVGKLKSQKDDVIEVSDYKNNRTRYYFEKHKRIDPRDVKISLEEAYSTMKQQIKQLKSIDATRIYEEKWLKNITTNQGSLDQIKDSFILKDKFQNNRGRDIKRLVRTSPSILSKVLINHPEFAKIICDVEDEIQNDQKVEEIVDETFFWGGIVVGGTLIGGGIISIGGRLLTRGVVARNFFTKLGSSIGYVGIGHGSLETTYWSSKVWDTKIRLEQYQMSYLSGLENDQALISVRNELENLNDATLNLAISFGFSALDLTTLYAFLKGGQNLEKSGLSLEKIRLFEMQNAKDTFNKILKDPVLNRIFQEQMKVAGARSLARFMGILGQMKKSTVTKSLNYLKKSTPKEQGEFINKVIDSIKGCS